MKKPGHIHVECPDGEAKFWLEPEIELAESYGLSDKQIKQIKKIITENYENFIQKWDDFFGGSN